VLNVGSSGVAIENVAPFHDDVLPPCYAVAVLDPSISPNTQERFSLKKFGTGTSDIVRLVYIGQREGGPGGPLRPAGFIGLTGRGSPPASGSLVT